MPELPEVETVRRGLERLIVGKSVAGVTHDTPKSFPNAPEDVKHFMIGAEVTSVKRRAKVLLIELSAEYTLVTHLKMTGQLVYRGDQVFGAGHPSDSLIGELPDRSTRVEVSFTDGTKLFFNDQRKFGWMRLLPSIEVPNISFMQKVGPEPLGNDFTPEEFIQRIGRRKNTTIKAAILDQTIVAGIGNIYADESLFMASIHPATRVKDVPEERLRALYHSIREVLALSIAQGGSTDKNYIDAEGKKGSYLQFAKVFRREGQPCSVCGTELIKTRVAGRGTHICNKCQPEIS